jgi:protein-arginine kinase
MGIIPNVDISTINELMVMGQPAHLKKYRDGDTAIKDLDEVRARVVAEKLRQ